MNITSEKFVERKSKPELRVGDANGNIGLPLSFDWRQFNKVTKVKDQQNCNSCYAFTVTATIESAIAIRNNLTVNSSKLLYFDNDDNINAVVLDLSEQQIVDCSDSGKYRNHGCDYGYVDDAYRYVIDNGLVSNNAYPYIDEV
jgi:hypothetical protein